MTSADLRLGSWQTALADVVEVDCLMVDAPYSERTHSGHDTGVKLADTYKGKVSKRTGDHGRTKLAYGPLSFEDVASFVSHWSPRTRGWFISITDHVLAPVWAEALESCGRYTFSPLAFVEPGSRVRMSGDGPSQWSCWVVVARPRHEPFSKWGSLPGAYVVPSGLGERADVINHGEARIAGMKPLWLMRALVRDYTRPGDLVCDPCAGGATTLLAALTEGRRAIGAEQDPATYELARKRLARGYTPAFAFGEVAE